MSPKSQKRSSGHVAAGKCALDEHLSGFRNHVCGELNREQVIRAGLNFERVQAHQERILMVLTSGRETTLPVVGACTTSNGAVIPWKTLVRFAEGERLTTAQRRARRAAFHYWCRQHLGTFIPAAGAASRFMASLERFIQDVNVQVSEVGDCCRRWYRKEQSSENLANRSKRLDSLSALAAIPLSADIKVIPQLLNDWNKTDVFKEFDRLSCALEVYFTEGRESEVFSDNNIDEKIRNKFRTTFWTIPTGEFTGILNQQLK